MNKIPLQFKEQHICYVANYIKRTAITSFGYLFADLRAALKVGDYQPNDLVTVEVDPQTLLNLHAELGNREENLTAGIHKQLKESLGTQIVALLSNPTHQESAGFIAEKLQAKDLQIDSWVANEVTEGRNYLLG